MKSFSHLKPTRAQFIGASIIATSMILSYAAVTVPHTFTTGTPAKADEVNANFDALNTRLMEIEGMASGKTTSDGSIDKSPQPPDVAGCTTSTNCSIGSVTHPYPSGNWLYLARYTPPSNGVVSVTAGAAIVCHQNASGAKLNISMFAADAAATFPPAAPGRDAIGFATVTIPVLTASYQIMPWDHGAALTGYIVTGSVLPPGTDYKIFLLAEILSGSTGGNCAFVESPVTLSFMPAKDIDISPTP